MPCREYEGKSEHFNSFFLTERGSMRSRNLVLLAFILLVFTTLLVYLHRNQEEEAALYEKYGLTQAVSPSEPMLVADNTADHSFEGSPFLTEGIIEADCLGLHYTATIRDTTIYYEKAGHGRPIILLHGNGGSHKSFQSMITQLVSAGFEVYAPDSRGQGANPPLTEYHYEDMAEDVSELIQEWDLEGPVIYGWSDGGIVGLLLCLRHPDVVRAMAISGANLFPGGLEDNFLAPLKLSNALVSNPLTTMILEEPDIDPEELGRITIPVLVTAGENDIVKPEHTALIAQSLPDGRLMILADETHSSYIIDSQVMGTMLIDFLKNL